MALEKKAENVVVLNVRKLTSVCDYIVVCSAESERQVQAIAYNIEDGLREKGERPLGSEGLTSGRWALVDYGDVVVHVFLENIRKFYDIEGLWSDAPAVEVRDKPAARKAVAKPAVEKALPSAAKSSAGKKAVAKKAVAKPVEKKASGTKASAIKKAAAKTSGKKAPVKNKAVAKAAKPAAAKPRAKKTKGE